MRAIVQDRYGGPEVLRLADVDPPVPGTGRVLIRVAAAGLDAGTVHLAAGDPLLVRLGTGLRAPRTRIPARDLAGTVEAVGPGVTRLRPGDAVFGIGTGALAELAVAKEDKLVPLPPGLAPERAAVVPVSGLTALQAVRDAARVQAGQHVLILGASGGVGTYAVQIARSLGARVTGTARTGKLDLVTGLGADGVIDHTRGDPLAAGPFDAILDVGARRPIRDLRRAVTRRGAVVLIGGESGNRLTRGFPERMLAAAVTGPFVPQRVRGLVSSENRADLKVLAALVADGTVTPCLDEVVPLAGAPAALGRLAAGEVRGKIAVAVVT